MPEPMVWHDEADRFATWGTLDPPDACMCKDCVLPPGCEHEWSGRGSGPDDRWQECWLCGKTRDIPPKGSAR